MDTDTEDNWAEYEFAETDLGDERRKKRLIRLATQMMENPEGSLPEMFEDGAGLKAAYRFFDNPANEDTAILQGHIAATYRRVKDCALILAPQDTTYLDYTTHPKTIGLGPTASDKQQGLIVHSTLLFTPERVPLGVIQAQAWARDPETYAKQSDHKSRKIEEKESNKWLVSLESVIEARRNNPNTRFVCIGDREADIYDLFAKERPEGVDLLVRAAQDRVVEDPERRRLWSALGDTPVTARVEVNVSPRKGQPRRTAELEIHWKEVKLHPPQARSSEKLPTVTVWAVWAIETAPPAGVKAVEWMLLTTVPVHSTSAALERLDWYGCRWGIEVWHKVLKSGCRIETRQLADAENLKRMLAVFSVIAWRILYAAMLARTTPDIPCTAILEPDEWQALYCTIHKTTQLPEQVPTLREAIRMIGRLGGFLGRKSDGEPGPKVLWKGFRRLNDLTMMYRLLRPAPGG